ncbi:ABC transporter substrate-binding protein [Alicyclobacillus sp. SO9]|uniref:ABC transporter substrate-binding protein n=1 Tax=Alicyclobacillus sp. SO9 TaxID=2665646 RepID=UPI0018E8213E|nr:ABC transporter substrate-binding protein [Alicyclobacillus sp. SO9]QQE78199.1 hypothetical protein GI364_20300 [Alicyclobacillus sp. SO9]
MNRRKKHVLTASTAVAMTLLTVAGCGTSNATSGTQNNSGTSSSQTASSTIKIALQNDVSGFDPEKTASASTFKVTNNIFDTLVDVKPNGQLQPGLATKWHVSKNGLNWTFDLRKNVLFQNGKTLTAADVKYTFDRILNKQTGDPNISDFSEIKSISIVSPQTVKFTLSKPYAPFLASMALPWAAVIEQGTGTNLKNKPIGTGPYKLVKWVPQQSITLTKFSKSWDAKQAHIKTIKFVVVPNQSTRLMDLKTGIVDVSTVSPANASSVKSNAKLQLLSSPSNAVQIMAMNNKSKPLNNILVRQAIEYAVNKPAIIKAVDFGYGQEIGSHMPPNSPYYVNLNKTYPYNLHKAKQLLKKAGYANGLTLNMALPQPYPIHIKTGQIIAQELKQIGITVHTKVIPWSQWLKNVYLGRHYQLTVITHTGRLDPAQLLDRYEAGNKGNYFNFSDPKVTKDLKQAVSTTNQEMRKKLYQQVQTLLAKDAANVFIQTPDNLIGMNKHVSGWSTYPVDIYNLRGVRLSH